MEWLNYHHLLYFWTVVREGSISKAAVHLRLAQPTVSAQVRQFEHALGETLLERRGRQVAVTEVGRLVYRYADEIFGLGRELQETLKGRPTGRAPRLRVGVANAVPKLIVYRLLRPAIEGETPIHVMCHEGQPEVLVAQLATHTLDVVISDMPAPANANVKVFSHLLGESDTSFFATPELARRLKRGFPQSLHQAPMLLPMPATELRRTLDQWFQSLRILPAIVGEFEDSALLKAFGESGRAVFPAPSAIAPEVCRHYGVTVVGETPAVRERYYAISAERRVTHPGVVALSATARVDLFAAHHAASARRTQRPRARTKAS
ncbi:transcriptional activator NhaR [Luteitalea sp.]|uniref:transcriptional activator NhaR n=1 Tax=Luteitalea sp. TaxID=2004800 RepID=UPI0025BA1367|nr:transcriptional activator NhaR [Luteitalea sp.]